LNKKPIKNEIVLYTVFHPFSISYLETFINNLEKQNYKRFNIFLCFNNLEKKKYINKIKYYKKQSFLDIDYTFQNRDPILVRKQDIKNLSLKYKKIIFLDSDDEMDFNRIKSVNKKLNKYDFVVNNIKDLKTNKIFFRKSNINTIKITSIINNSFIGLSNLAVNSKSLKKIINKINKKLLVLDWQLATLLLLFKFKGIYVGNVFTKYRVHRKNFIGQNNSLKNLDKKNKIKLLHYDYFSKYNNIFKKKYKDLKLKKKKINNLNKNEFYNT
jgi:hypothetical protein